MRLIGSANIVVYLGWSARNRRAWPRIRQQYGHLIRYDAAGRAWALSEELDRWDQERFRTAREILRPGRG